MQLVKQVEKVKRTAEGLREALFDELDALRRGESNPQHAQAVAKLASAVVNSVRMEIEFASKVGAEAANPSFGKLALAAA